MIDFRYHVVSIVAVLLALALGLFLGSTTLQGRVFDDLKGRANAPKGADWDAAVASWKNLQTDPDAVFDKEVFIDATTLTPYVSWGTNPGQVLPID